MKIRYVNIEIYLPSKTATAENGRRRMGLMKKNGSNIAQWSSKEIQVNPTVVVSKYSQDYSSDDKIDKEYIVSRAHKLRKEQTHQDVEEHLHTTTICELQYVCVSQKKEIWLLHKTIIHIQEQAKNAIEKARTSMRQ